MPKSVCNLCVERLLDAIMIREMCIESESALHNIEAMLDYEIKAVEEPVEVKHDVTLKQESVEEANDELYEMELTEYYIEEERLEEEKLDDGTVLIEQEEDEEENETEQKEIPVENTTFMHVRSPPRRGETTYERKLRKLKEKRKRDRELGIKPKKRLKKCCQCQFQAEKAASVQEHFRKAHWDKREPEPKSKSPFRCCLCLKSFESREEQIRHARKQSRRRHLCEDCGQDFDSLEVYRHHLKTDHGVMQEFRCDECPKIYNNVNSLRGHKETQHKGIRHVCDECGAVYRRADTLREHKNVHKLLQPYECPCCDAKFARKTGLSSHLKSHTGERPYACEYCNKTFAFATDKKRHLPVHTGIYPYNCHICSKGFTRKTELNQHLENHEVA